MCAPRWRRGSVVSCCSGGSCWRGPVRSATLPSSPARSAQATPGSSSACTSRDTEPDPLPKEATVAATILSEDTFDRSEYAAELDAAPGNLAVGTRLWLENDHIRVW